MKSTNNFLTVKFAIVVVCLFIVNMIFGQGAHPGTDPDGMPVPVDGGILMALLAGGGLMAMLLKKKRKDE